MNWQQWNQSTSLNTLDQLRGFKRTVVTTEFWWFFNEYNFMDHCSVFTNSKS